MSTSANAWQSAFFPTLYVRSSTITSILVAGVELSFALSILRNSICSTSSERARTSFLSQPRTVTLPDMTQSVTVTIGLAGVERSIFSEGRRAFLSSLAGAKPAREMIRPSTAAGTAENFIIKLEPGPFSVLRHEHPRSCSEDLLCSDKQQT